MLKKRPTSIGSRYGRAKSLDRMAELHKNNDLLDKAIEGYQTLIMDMGSKMSDDFYINITKRCIDMMRFKGFYKKYVIFTTVLLYYLFVSVLVKVST